MATLAPIYAELNQHEAVRSAVASVQVPPGVSLHKVELDTDHSGDPAVYVSYRVSRRIPLTKKRVRELVALQDAAASAVDALQTGRFPYIRLVD